MITSPSLAARPPTLYIYVDEDDITAARDSIEKLELVFEAEESDEEETTDTSNVSYTITKKDYESDGCDALIKAKDEKSGYDCTVVGRAYVRGTGYSGPCAR